MHRVLDTRFTTSPPPAPQHTGAPLRVGELCLLRRPDEWFDVKVELRAIDDGLALVRIRDRGERVQLAWLRRS
jgi:hypothetical protein